MPSPSAALLAMMLLRGRMIVVVLWFAGERFGAQEPSPHPTGGFETEVYILFSSVVVRVMVLMWVVLLWKQMFAPALQFVAVSFGAQELSPRPMPLRIQDKKPHFPTTLCCKHYISYP